MKNDVYLQIEILRLRQQNDKLFRVLEDIVLLAEAAMKEVGEYDIEAELKEAKQLLKMKGNSV